MTTYGVWLDDQAGRSDATGAVARVWAAAASERGRGTSVAIASRWLNANAERCGELAPPQFFEAVRQSAAEYRQTRGDLQAGVRAAHGEITATGPAMLAALGRIETMIAEQQQGVAEILARTAELLALAGRGTPGVLTGPAAEAVAAESVAAVIEQGPAGPPYASASAPGPEPGGGGLGAWQGPWGPPADAGPFPGPALYGGHEIAPPDFARLSELGSGGDGEDGSGG